MKNEIRETISQVMGTHTAAHTDAAKQSLSVDSKINLIRRMNRTWPKRHIDTIPHIDGPVAETVERLSHIVTTGSGIILLCGDRGRGKTQIATCLAFERTRQGFKSGIYVRAFDLFTMVKQSWSDKDACPEWRLLGDLKTTPFLVIDELQDRSDSEWETRLLNNIIDHRYADERCTVVISNLTPSGLSKSLGPSILDRAAETGGLVECNWKSYR